MNRLDRVAEPSALLRVETRDGGGEVGFLFVVRAAEGRWYNRRPLP
jgi:hypothetical protein